MLFDDQLHCFRIESFCRAAPMHKLTLRRDLFQRGIVFEARPIIIHAIFCAEKGDYKTRACKQKRSWQASWV
jgi:hypothetical protein